MSLDGFWLDGSERMVGKREEGGLLSSMYQLHGSSTRVLSVGGDGVGSGFIQDDAER